MEKHLIVFCVIIGIFYTVDCSCKCRSFCHDIVGLDRFVGFWYRIASFGNNPVDCLNANIQTSDDDRYDFQIEARAVSRADGSPITIGINLHVDEKCDSHFIVTSDTPGVSGLYQPIYLDVDKFELIYTCNPSTGVYFLELRVRHNQLANADEIIEEANMILEANGIFNKLEKLDLTGCNF